VAAAGPAVAADPAAGPALGECNRTGRGSTTGDETGGGWRGDG